MADSGQLRAEQAVRDLERARRNARRDQIDFWDALYNAYVAGFSIAGAAVLIASVLPQDQISTGELAFVVSRGPAFIGLLTAIAVYLGLRSGRRGGPLVFDAPTVHYILQAPVDRSFVARRAALKQLRTAAAWGAGAGVALGLGASIALPGGVLWLGIGFGFVGLCTGVAVFAAALVVSGRRIDTAALEASGIGLLGWSVLDTVLATATSPFSLLGRFAVVQETGNVSTVIGVVVVAAMLFQGFATAGGVSLESSRRRADLVSQIRFAVTMQDLRTVVVLRRRLTGQTHRMRTWIPLERQSGIHLPALRRTFRGILHAPNSTVVRIGAMTVASGALVGFAGRGFSPLALGAGLLLFVVGYDFVEALAQEVDRPSLWRRQPVRHGDLVVRLILSGAGCMAPVALIAAAVAAAVGGPASGLVALPVFALATVAASVGAGVSTVLGAPNASPYALNTELFAISTVPRILIPPALTILPFVPVAGGFAASDPAPSVIFSSMTAVAIPCGLALLWLRSRKPRMI